MSKKQAINIKRDEVPFCFIRETIFARQNKQKLWTPASKEEFENQLGAVEEKQYALGVFVGTQGELYGLVSDGSEEKVALIHPNMKSEQMYMKELNQRIKSDASPFLFGMYLRKKEFFQVLEAMQEKSKQAQRKLSGKEKLFSAQYTILAERFIANFKERHSINYFTSIEEVYDEADAEKNRYFFIDDIINGHKVTYENIVLQTDELMTKTQLGKLFETGIYGDIHYSLKKITPLTVAVVEDLVKPEYDIHVFESVFSR